MNRSTLRVVIIILTLATAIVHGILLNIRMGGIDPAFTLNAIGYLTLMAVLFFVKVPFLQGRAALVHYVYIGFAVVTIVAYFVVSTNPFTDILGLVTKVIEVLLVIALWMHLQLTEA